MRVDDGVAFVERRVARVREYTQSATSAALVGTTRTIPHRELRNNSAEVLRAVEAGETFQITNHGEVVAVLSPPPAPPLSGIKHYPARKRGRLSDVQRRTIPGGTGAILDELREER